MSNYIEPRLRRDFGGIITAFFNFMKANIKGLINVFVGYNGVFFILFLISVYFLITGFVQFLIANTAVFVEGPGSREANASLAMGFSILFLILLIAIATIFNYALSSSYLSLYERQKQNNIPKRAVWLKAKSMFWGILLIGLCGVVLYFVYFIVQIMLAFIPILGTIVSLVFGLAFNAWISLTIFSYVHNKEKNIFDAFGEAWQLLFSGFWKTLGVNFVLGFLVQVCLLSLQIVPAIIAGVIAFHAIEDSGSFTDSTISHILIILILTLLCIMIMFIQMISQIINGFLYFNLHEFKNNEYLRSRIAQIGTAE
jgi:uncharacterized protein involved in cysteine biosynthesis